MEDVAKCQSIYRNLLQVLQARGVPQERSAASVFLRELQHTSRCDAYHDFTRIRKAYEEHVGHDSMKRIASFDETEKDERRAEQALVHYHDFSQKSLVAALDWEGWLKFHTIDKAERTVASFTTTGSVHGGWRFARSASYNWSRNQEEQQQ
eukprot:CAMPEP_0202898606 /NCGR_PEP_ID=MMETSP1392-20130828/7082_1 /ASSEMBLY_ACC=CAM_ASM_000868 /TAXON_ID=225041 /ORGANISM="Chlamydomonas chlamydogama, Strain SAG 11-48b" /LENGTH=150 /DNA_ID=CAMNT_0049584587 /DNA_START=700 /DNA_END=1152 /DNA_ORIENTATION=+